MSRTPSKAETLVSRLTVAAFVAQQVWTIGRDWSPRVSTWWKNYHSREIKVKSDCAFYHDVLLWLLLRSQGRKKTRSLEIINGAARDPWSPVESADEEVSPILLVPAVNQPTEFIFQGCKVVVRREDNRPPAGEKRVVTPDTITIRVETRSDQVVEDLVEEIKAEAKRRRNRGISVRTYQWGSWRVLCKVDFGERQAILPTGHYDGLSDDLKWFLSNHAWYKKRGIPYQRGYLFHGTAGNGKTTTAISLATSFGLDLCILNLGSRMMSDETLQEAVAGIPVRAALLLEDFDCAFTNRQVKGQGDLTFSGILNALDGAMSAEGRIAFITTNHVDQIDSALLRPGRVDRRVQFANPDTDQIKALVKRFYPECDRDSYPEYKGNSMATIQEMLVREAMEERP